MAGAQLGSGTNMLGDSGGGRANYLHSQGLAAICRSLLCDRDRRATELTVS